MKKNYFFSVLMLAFSFNLSAQMPETLFMRGSALSEATEIQMKRIPAEFPASYQGNLAESNTFELITALRTGTYEFATTAGGDALITSAAIEVTTDKDLVPYRIRVNFDEAEPVVVVSEIEEVYMYAPWNKASIYSFNYIGNSTFWGDYISYDKTIWGDPRYRFKMVTVDGDMTTYSYITNPNLSAPNDDSNETGWFDLYTTTNLDAWDETIDGTKYVASEFKLSPKRRGEGFDLAPFSVTIIFSPEEGVNYTHVIQDYDPNYQPPVVTPIPDPNFIADAKEFKGSIYPTAIENSVTIAAEESGFAVEFVSMTGNAALKAVANGSTLVLNDIDLPQGIYLVKVTRAEQVLGVKRVVKLLVVR